MAGVDRDGLRVCPHWVGVCWDCSLWPVGYCAGLGLVAVLLGCPVGVFLMGVLLWREKSCEGGFWGCVVMFGKWACWGGRGWVCFVQGGVLCFGLFGCACAGLAPRAPLLLVGGRRRARGGMVRAEDAGLCALEIRGLSPLTPVEAVQGCPLVAVDVRRHMGFFCSRR